jgi:hypothetical protein
MGKFIYFLIFLKSASRHGNNNNAHADNNKKKRPAPALTWKEKKDRQLLFLAGCAENAGNS